MSTLITGASGFVGLHLTENLCRHGYQLVCQVRDRERFAQQCRAQMGGLSDAIKVGQADFTDPASVDALFGLAPFETVVHLAGMSSPPECDEFPDRTKAINVDGTRLLLEAARARGWKGTFLLVSSAQVYAKLTDRASSLTESSPLHPDNEYSRSKLEAERVARSFAGKDIRVIVARPFNHVGPGQSSRFAIPTFLENIHRAKLAGQKTFQVGDLSASKDFTDVRDVVEAYRILLESSAPRGEDIYNVCSGELVSMDTVVSIARDVAGTPDMTWNVAAEGARKGDPLFMRGSAGPLKDLGWKPGITLRESIADTFANLRNTGGEAA